MATNRELRVIDHETGEIVAAPGRPFRLLDVYAEDGVVESDARPTWRATISAGRKVTVTKNGREVTYPEVSRDGTIYISGGIDEATGEDRCPHLREALTATDNKKLTIFFPYDDLDGFVIQRFAARSATALQVYGDGEGITEIEWHEEPDLDTRGNQKRDPQTGQPMVKQVPEHVTHLRGSKRYRELIKLCKVETHVLFGLARWDGTKAICTFPDGYGYYAIRFTSRNSARAIVGRIEEIKERVTRGRLAGLPFDLSLVYRNVAGPDGKTRNVPIWNLDFNPPISLELTSGNFAQIIGGALDEGRRLSLPPPPTYTLAQAAAENDDVDLDVAAFTDDPPCNPNYWRGIWYVVVRDTPLDTDDARHAFVAKHTRGAYASLERFLENASEQEASDLIAAVGESLDAPVRERIAAVLQRSPKLGEMQRRMDDADYYAHESIQARREPEGPKVIDHEPEPRDRDQVRAEPAPEPAAPKPKSRELELRGQNMHILRRAIGWDEDTYHDTLERTFGVRSSALITKAQAEAFAGVLSAEAQAVTRESRPGRLPSELEGLRALGWTDEEPELESTPTEGEQPSLLGAEMPTEGDEAAYGQALQDAYSLIENNVEIELADCDRDGETMGVELRERTARLRKRIDAAAKTRQAARR